MKKLFFALVTAVALISFTSCSDTTKGPNEIKAVEMFKNMGECLDQNNQEEFTKLAEEFDEWFGSLPGKDMEKVKKAVMEWDKKKAEAIIKAAEEVLPKYQQKEK
jgi:hypothetical protein